MLIIFSLFKRYHQDLLGDVQDSPVCDFLHDMDDSYIERNDDNRVVIDFIAGMTDDFFNNQYQKLFMPQNYGYRLETK